MQQEHERRIIAALDQALAAMTRNKTLENAAELRIALNAWTALVDEPDPFSDLAPGLYRIYWKDDGPYSLATVGMDSSGRRWMAPSNWVTVPSYDWSKVERVELIATPEGN
jgi:hypothetical protein